MPTFYRVRLSKAKHGGTYVVETIDPHTGKWALQITHDDLDFITEWAQSRGLTLQPKKANLTPTAAPESQS